MEPLHAETLKACHCALVKDLDIDIVDYLFQEGLFTDEDVDRVRKQADVSVHQGRRKLLGILRTKGPTAYEKLLQGLWNNVGQRHLREKLLKEEKRLRNENEGGVQDKSIDHPNFQHLVTCLKNGYREEVGRSVAANEITKFLHSKTESYTSRPAMTTSFIGEVVGTAFPGSKLIQNMHSLPISTRDDDRMQGVFVNIIQDTFDDAEEAEGMQSPKSDTDDDETAVLKLGFKSGNVEHSSQNKKDAEDKDAGMVHKKVICATGRSSGIEAAKPMVTWTEADVCNWLLTLGIEKEEVRSKVHDQKIDGEELQYLNMDELKEVFGDSLVFGEKKKILRSRDRTLSSETEVAQESTGTDVSAKCKQEKLMPGEDKSNTAESAFIQKSPENETVSSHRTSEILRPFDKEVGVTFKYKIGAGITSAMVKPSDLMVPVHQFTYLDLSQKGSLQQLGKDVVKFVCACLNDRTNGTIHFGIKPGPMDSSAQAVVVGTCLTRKQGAYTAFLDKAIDECFFPDQKDLVRGCVRPPKFVEVLAEGTKKFVVEIDVVPESILCGDDVFYARLPDEKVDKKLKFNKGEVYRFLDGRVLTIDGNDLRVFMSTTPKLFELRQKKEDRKWDGQQLCNPDLREKLVSLLCQGENRFVGDTYPILVINKPSEYMDKEYLSFLTCVPWKAVFDFDSTAEICNFMALEKEQVMKIISSCSDFSSRSTQNLLNPERLKALHEDIRCSVQYPWLFVNGYDPLKKDAERKLDQLDWNKIRRESFNDAVRFFGNEIPEGRAIVVFCLFSKDWEVMLEGAEEFMSTFPDQWMCIAEDDFTAKPLVEELIRRKRVERKSSSERIVSGMPWRHVNETIQGLQDRKLSEAFEIICSDGSFCSLKERTKNELVDLEILASNECDTSEMVQSSEQLDAHRKEMEERFYKGNEVDWWNFWFQDHICRRCQHQNLYQNVSRALHGKLPSGEDDHVARVVLYHEPGAGGTTLAKHILWDFRRKYRCAIVRTLSDQTADQIMTFRSHKDNDISQPVLLLVDNEDEEKTNFLAADLEERAKRITREQMDPTRVICVMLVCLRRTKLRYSPGCVMLNHQLKPEERSWFQKKGESLEQRFSERSQSDPKLLISFNILKEDFSPKYIEQTVKSFVSEMDNDKERQLLKYVAFLNTYDVQQRPVPTSAFDYMMFEMSYQDMKKGKTLTYGLACGYGTQRRWETKLSTPFCVLTNETTKTGMGYIHALRIINPLLSKKILDVLGGMDGQSLSDVAFSFLNNKDIFHVPTGMAKRDLLKITNDVLKSRRRHISGRPESEFPPIIHDLMAAESVEKAKELLSKGFDLTGDPFIAQQIARVLMHIQSWDEALHYAKLATDKKADNSYLWHTYGRVFQSQLIDQYKQLISEDTTLSIPDALAITSDAFKGIHKFHKVQELRDREYKIALNDAGYFGELEIVINLLDCLSFLELFKHDREKLHKFLVDDTYIPPELNVPGVQDHTFVEDMKQLHVSVKQAISRLEDERLHLREEILDDYRKSNHSLSNLKLTKLKENLASYFGESCSTVPTGIADDSARNYRERRIFQLAGWTLKSVFDLIEEPNGETRMKEIQSLTLQNIESGLATANDFQTMLSVCFGLMLINEKNIYEIKYENMIRWSRQLYELRDRQDYISLEPYLFYTMINWPRKGNKPEEHVTPNVITVALKMWKDAYYRKYPRQRAEDKPYRKKDKTMFFLANGSGIHSVVTYAELREESGEQRGMRSDTFWKESYVLRRLKRFQGFLLDDGCEVQLNLEYDEKHQGSVKIPTSFPIRNRALWNKSVFFVIGFSWFGPKAFDVNNEDPTENPEGFAEGGRKFPGVRGKIKVQGDSRTFEKEVMTHRQFRQELEDIDANLTEINRIEREVQPGDRTQNQKNLIGKKKQLTKDRNKLIERRKRSTARLAEESI